MKMFQQVKAGKYYAKNSFDGLVNSPTTPKYEKQFPDVLVCFPR